MTYEELMRGNDLKRKLEALKERRGQVQHLLDNGAGLEATITIDGRPCPSLALSQDMCIALVEAKLGDLDLGIEELEAEFSDL